MRMCPRVGGGGGAPPFFGGGGGGAGSALGKCEEAAASEKDFGGQPAVVEAMLQSSLVAAFESQKNGLALL